MIFLKKTCYALPLAIVLATAPQVYAMGIDGYVDTDGKYVKRHEPIDEEYVNSYIAAIDNATELQALETVLLSKMSLREEREKKTVSCASKRKKVKVKRKFDSQNKSSKAQDGDGENDVDGEFFKANFQTESSVSNLLSKDPVKKRGVSTYSLMTGAKIGTRFDFEAPDTEDYAVDESPLTDSENSKDENPDIPVVQVITITPVLMDATQPPEILETTHEKEEKKLTSPISPISQNLDKDGKTRKSDAESHKLKKEEYDRNYGLCGLWASNKRVAQEALKPNSTLLNQALTNRDLWSPIIQQALTNVEQWDLLTAETEHTPGLAEAMEAVLMQSIVEK